MSIEYKTEGKAELTGSSICHVTILKWVKGNSAVDIHQGKSYITIDKNQLLELARIAKQIGDDLQPEMGSLPRCSE